MDRKARICCNGWADVAVIGMELKFCNFKFVEPSLKKVKICFEDVISHAKL